MKNIKSLVSVAAVLLFVAPTFGQTISSLTAEDYARAEKMLAYNTAPLVDRSGVRPTFLQDGRFWYQVLTATGREFVMVDPATGAKKVGQSLSEIGVTTPAVTGSNRVADRNASRSPDGRKEVFIRDWNLWARDVASGAERPLTRDGIKDYGYATDNAGWTHSDRAIVLWSPDSKKIATFRQDQRGVSDMYLVSTNVGAPKLESWKYPLPTDKRIILIERVIIEVDTPKVIELKISADARRGTLCDDISCTGAFDDNAWSADGSTLAFVSTSRDHKEAKFRIANATTGAVREVFEEKVATQYESGQGAINWKYFPRRMKRSGIRNGTIGTPYLYDLKTGKPKQQITKGNFVVTRILKIDETARVIYFEANGREKGRDPYFSHFYRINFEGNGLALLTPEDGNHQITLSPDGKHFVDSFSKPDVPPVAVARDMSGRLIANLETGDVSRLRAAGWKPVNPIKVKSRDSKWDLYGLMFTPTNLDPAKKYPVVNYIIWPSSGAASGHAISGRAEAIIRRCGTWLCRRVIDGTCNPDRSKSFHDSCYGNMADNTSTTRSPAFANLPKSSLY